MTLDLLRNKHMPALNLFFFSLKKNLPLMILALAFMALVNPGLLLTYVSDNLENIAKNDMVDLSDMIHVIGLGTTVSTSLLSMLFCLINFSYLYKKPAGDVFHALPISRTKLLLSRYFASVVPALAPALLSYVSVTLICLIDRVEGNIADIWIHAALNVGILLVMSAMTMIFLVCAGNMFSFIASLGGLNVGIPIILYVGIELCDNYLFGFISDFDIIYYCTPAFFAFSRYMYVDEEKFAPILWQLPWLILIAAVCLVVAILLYNRRKSEKSGETYAFSFVYYIVSVLLSVIGAFGVGYIFSEGDFDLAFWVFGLFGGLLTAIAFGALTDKGFKTVKRSAILGGCAYVIMLTFTFAIILDITGYEKHFPKTEDVKQVTVTEAYRSVGDLVLTDATDVIALHKAIVYNRYGDRLYAGGVTLVYELKDGRTISREYSINTEAAVEALVELWKNDEYQQKQLDAFTAISADPTKEYNYNLEYYYGEESHSVSLSADEAKQLLTVYFTDLKKADISLFDEDKGDVPSVSLYGQSYRLDDEYHYTGYQTANLHLRIGESTENTLAYVQQLIEQAEGEEPYKAEAK